MTLLQTKSYEYNKYHSFVENIKQELNKCYLIPLLKLFSKNLGLHYQDKDGF